MLFHLPDKMRQSWPNSSDWCSGRFCALIDDRKLIQELLGFKIILFFGVRRLRFLVSVTFFFFFFLVVGLFLLLLLGTTFFFGTLLLRRGFLGISFFCADFHTLYTCGFSSLRCRQLSIRGIRSSSNVIRDSRHIFSHRIRLKCHVYFIRYSRYHPL